MPGWWHQFVSLAQSGPNRSRSRKKSFVPGSKPKASSQLALHGWLATIHLSCPHFYGVMNCCWMSKKFNQRPVLDRSDPKQRAPSNNSWVLFVSPIKFPEKQGQILKRNLKFKADPWEGAPQEGIRVSEGPRAQDIPEYAQWSGRGQSLVSFWALFPRVGSPQR